MHIQRQYPQRGAAWRLRALGIPVLAVWAGLAAGCNDMAASTFGPGGTGFSGLLDGGLNSLFMGPGGLSDGVFTTPGDELVGGVSPILPPTGTPGTVGPSTIAPTIGGTPNITITPGFGDSTVPSTGIGGISTTGIGSMNTGGFGTSSLTNTVPSSGFGTSGLGTTGGVVPGPISGSNSVLGGGIGSSVLSGGSGFGGNLAPSAGTVGTGGVLLPSSIPPRQVGAPTPGAVGF